MQFTSLATAASLLLTARYALALDVNYFGEPGCNTTSLGNLISVDTAGCVATRDLFFANGVTIESIQGANFDTLEFQNITFYTDNACTEAFFGQTSKGPDAEVCASAENIGSFSVDTQTTV